MDTDFKDLALRTIISQYGASPHVRGIIERIGEHLDPTADIKLFYDKIFNISTAEGVGLDMWGRIVGAGREIYVPQTEGFFGYRGSLLNPWNISPFYYSRGATNIYQMNDISYRKMIMYKALANISDDTLPAIKELMSLLFERSVLAIETAGVMHLRIIFDFFLSAQDYALVQMYGLLNRGAGVSFDLYESPSAETFGFYGSKRQGFDNGVFEPFGIIQA